MRQRFFLIALLITIVVVTAALVPLTFVLGLKDSAGAGTRRIAVRTRRRISAAGERIVRRIREATA